MNGDIQRAEESTPGCLSDSAVLTQAQATELLQVLDNTRHVLHNYLEILEDGEVPPKPKRRKGWWGRHCWPNKRRVLYKHITIVTVALQFTNLIVLTLIDAWPRYDKGEWQFLVASSCTMIFLQVINLFFLILASGRLVKQIYRHAVNKLFLGQSYLATLLLFAGIYTLTYRLDRTSWKFINETFQDPAQVFFVYAKFLFYSISTATLCGSDNVLPVDWYNCIFAGIQMLLSFCYFASILGLAMSPEITKPNEDTTSSQLPQQQQRPKSAISISSRQTNRTATPADSLRILRQQQLQQQQQQQLQHLQQQQQRQHHQQMKEHQDEKDQHGTSVTNSSLFRGDNSRSECVHQRSIITPLVHPDHSINLTSSLSCNNSSSSISTIGTRDSSRDNTLSTVVSMNISDDELLT